MTMVDTEEVVTQPFSAAAARLDTSTPVRVQGKFFFVGDKKHFVKGVTYGPFPKGSHGAQFPEYAIIHTDFALMAKAGINTVRVFTVPPLWLLDAAQQARLKILVGLPWSQHVAFLDSPAIQAQIREAVTAGVRACRHHPAVFAYLIGNEIPPDMVRWHGAEAVRSFLRSLVTCAKTEHPEALVSYANYPSTEYLTVDFTDFVCFNVYLHDQPAFRRYIARLHNVALDQPLVLTEFGVDSFGEGEEEQRRSCLGRCTPHSRPASPAPSSLPGRTNGSPAVIWSRIGPLAWSTGSAGQNGHSTRSCANTPVDCRPL